MGDTAFARIANQRYGERTSESDRSSPAVKADNHFVAASHGAQHADVGDGSEAAAGEAWGIPDDQICLPQNQVAIQGDRGGGIRQRRAVLHGDGAAAIGEEWSCR